MASNIPFQDSALPVKDCGLRVRAARIWDWARLRGLMHRLFPQVDDATLGLWLRDQRHCFAVALLEGRMVGVVRLEVQPGHRLTRLTLIGVDAAARGRGVARAMLAYCEEVACACGAPHLVSDVAPQDEGSLAFFAHVGFGEETQRPTPSGFGELDSGFGALDGADVKRLGRRAVPPTWPAWQLKREHAPRVPAAPYQRLVLRALYGAWVGGARTA